MANHIVFGTYGFWLPNDPRGSGSDYVGHKSLFVHYGPQTKVIDSRSHAKDKHDSNSRLQAKKSLPQSPVVLDDSEREIVGNAFEKCFNHFNLKIPACAIMPDHVHLILENTPEPTHRFIARLKSAATKSLRQQGRMKPGNKIWAKSFRKTHISSEEHLSACIKYIKQNPIKAGMPEQYWPFIRRGSS